MKRTWSLFQPTIFRCYMVLLHANYCSSQQCYNSDRNIAKDNIPCYPDRNVSFCCGKGWACLNNKLCQQQISDDQQSSITARGSCTDQTWESDDCPRFYIGMF